MKQLMLILCLVSFLTGCADKSAMMLAGGAAGAGGGAFVGSKIAGLPGAIGGGVIGGLFGGTAGYFIADKNQSSVQVPAVADKRKID